MTDQIYLVYSSNAALFVHTEPILLPERTFTIEIYLTYVLVMDSKLLSLRHTWKYLKNGILTSSLSVLYTSPFTLSIVS